jgi:hypothetical protein
MSENIKNTAEEAPPKPKTEIDLGQLFRIIGSGFNSFLIFLRSTFLFLFDLLIRALIIVRLHFVKFTIVGVIGVVIGFFIDARHEDVYVSSMYVEANYGSKRQLYSNIKSYQAYVIEKDSAKLADIFGINKIQAGSLRGFFIKPDVTENGMLEAYSKFMRKTDSTFVKDEIDFRKFKQNVSPLDFNIHRISIFSTQKGIIQGLQPIIVTKNIENIHVKKQKEVKLKSLEQEQSLLKKQLVKIDTLSKVYKDLLRASPKESETTGGTGTYFQMAEKNENKTKELEMFTIDLQRELNSETINVLSTLSELGEDRDFYDRYLFRIPIMTLLLLFAFILLKELNKYMNTYIEDKRLNF